MLRGLLAAAMAFAVVATPIAANICEATCQDHNGQIKPGLVSSHHHDSAPQTHAGHHHEPVDRSLSVSNAVAVAGVPHICGRDGTTVTEARERIRGSTVSTLATSIAGAPVPPGVFAVAADDNRHGPPAPVRALPQLRI